MQAQKPAPSLRCRSLDPTKVYQFECVASGVVWTYIPKQCLSLPFTGILYSPYYSGELLTHPGIWNASLPHYRVYRVHKNGELREV